MALNRVTIGGTIMLGAALAMTSGCTSIKQRSGYIADVYLVDAVRAGIDNQRSVLATLGDPTFRSDYGQPTWFYVTTVTGQTPLAAPVIKSESVVAVKFDSSGNVVAVDRTGADKVARIRPDGDYTPTAGRDRGFLEDLFGNIGTVGAGAGAPGAGGPGG